MKERRFGRTGHLSSVAIFGGAALWTVTPEEADHAIQMALDAGVNHVDVAPSYGQAEEHLGRWMHDIRNRIFLGCKTMERTAAEARREMETSLDKLGVDTFDLYQLHAVTSIDELEQCFAKGGALQGILKAHEEGLSQHIGITSHGYNSPIVLMEALHRFDFDTITFPYNFIQAADPSFRARIKELLRVCTERAVGTMVIKSVAKGPWREEAHPDVPWYEPFKEPAMVQAAVNFALSQPVTGLCATSSLEVLPTFLRACENLKEMDGAQQDKLIARAGEFEPLFPKEERE